MKIILNIKVWIQFQLLLPLKRNKQLAIEANCLFHQYIQMVDVPASIREISFFDNTSMEEAVNGQMTIMVKAGNKNISVTEFLEKLESYLIKKNINF